MTIKDPLPGATLDESSLEAWLATSGVDTSKWGVGEAKTVAHLLVELREGDCEIAFEGTSLVRRVRNVWIDVYAVGDVKRRHLVEQVQVFNDGRTRERDVPASLGEKCKVGEDPAIAARRGVAEELGITAPFEVVPMQSRENPVGKSSYPGLRTVYDTSWFQTELAGDAYRAEGYVEVQADKSTYFEWVT